MQDFHAQISDEEIDRLLNPNETTVVVFMFDVY